MIKYSFDLRPDQIAPIERMIDEAHGLAEAINDLIKDEDSALAAMLLVTLNAYLEHVQRCVLNVVGLPQFRKD
ncbi:hypothetical protein [Antrihabitans sp. YC2-6]|uniref:hypothetical protein n=1 Tax=Antrihabitans sp. YC2-6 TaxID=2799498 RepID=UPI0018F288D5|nr:hypothetical protein [Antrihabitans sp. YC2-6]MBJ8343924.1 hypothetical protein [Antrihabitans sp. YC2-6]